MDDRVTADTVNVVESVIPVTESVAVIVIGPPTAKAERTPLVPAALLILATGVFSGTGAQVTDAVRSCIDLSVYIPVALNCCVVPFVIVRVTGVTTSDESVALVTVNVVESVFPVATSVAVIVLIPTVDAVA